MKKGEIKIEWTEREDTIIKKGLRSRLTYAKIHKNLPQRSLGAVKSRIMRIRGASKIKQHKTNPVTEEPLATGEGYELKGNDENRILLLRSETIRDPHKALAEANVDLDIWEIKDFVVNKWDMAAKRKDQDSLMVTELWQVKVWLRLKDKNPIKTALEGALDKIAKHAPKYPKIKTKPKGDHLLEISLFDSHFGKLAWGRETGQDYDLNIAKKIYQHAIEDLINKTKSFGIERILFPVGQDFFHIDDATYATPKGKNRLDVDGRLGNLEMCLGVAPVDVIWVPGNHDRQTSMYLCKYLKAWFRHIPERIVIDDSPKFRKYKLYGVNLIGFTHGDCEKQATLRSIMAGEEPELWARSRFREWHLGHFHKKKETSYSVGDSHVGVMVKVLPSLCGTDAWHYEMGYVQNIRSAEAYLWNKKEGYAGHLASNIL